MRVFVIPIYSKYCSKWEHCFSFNIITWNETLQASSNRHSSLVSTRIHLLLLNFIKLRDPRLVSNDSDACNAVGKNKAVRDKPLADNKNMRFKQRLWNKRITKRYQLRTHRKRANIYKKMIGEENCQHFNF